MTQTLEDLEAIIRERICRVCTDRTVEGECGLEDPSSCALFRLFPQVARAVQSVSSDDIRDYIRAIREQVCSVCSEQTSDGECESRKQVQCALDAYLLPVVDAIEESTGKSFDRNRSGDITQSSAPRLGDITPERAPDALAVLIQAERFCRRHTCRRPLKCSERKSSGDN